MLDFSVTQANFHFGLAEDTEPHQVPPGTLLTAENCRWQKGGRIEKRYGTTALTRSILGGGTLSAASRLFTRGGELCAIDGQYLSAYSPTSSAWRQVSKVPEVGLTWQPLVDVSTGLSSQDVALSSAGMLVHAWTTGDPQSGTAGDLYVQVKDTASGGLVIPPTKLATSNNYGVRVLVIGTTAIVLTRNGAVAATYTIQAYTVDLSSRAISTVTTLVTDMHTALGSSGFAGYDATVIGSNFVIAYNKTGPHLALHSYTSALASVTTGEITSETNGCRNVAIAGAVGEVLYVFYAAGGSTGPQPMRIAIADPSTLAQAVAPVTVDSLTASGESGHCVGICRYDSTHATVSYAWLDGSTWRLHTYKVSSSAVVDSMSLRGLWHTMPITRPFMFGGRCYMAVADTLSLSGTTPAPFDTGFNSALVEIEISVASGGAMVPHRYVGKIHELVAGNPLTGAPLANAALLSTTRAILPLTFQATAASTLTNWRQGAHEVTLTLGSDRPADLWRPVSYASEVYVAGPVLSAYDGRTLFDYGFYRTPTWLSITPSTSGGGIEHGNYTYGGALEYRSAAGVLHRGAQVKPATTTVTDVADDNSVALAVEGINLGNKQTVATGFGVDAALPTIFATHRSVKGGPTLYRLSYEPAFNVLNVNQVVESPTLTDTKADTDIGYGTALATRPTLYTTGGILDDEQPPAFTTMTLLKQRLWGIDGSQTQAWFSKSFLDDYGVAPGFSTSFRVQFDAPVVALATLDDKLVAFASDRLWAVLGDGPAPNGEGPDYQVIPVQSSVGCTNPRSVVSTSDGVMFLTSRGLYLLTRQLETVFIGGPVQDQLAAYPNVTSAVVVAKRNEVRWTCNDAGSTAGVVLVYNYVAQQWSTARYTANSVYGVPFADACIWQGQWTAVTPDGFVLQESESTSLDGAAWVPMTIETAWVSAAGPVGYAAVDSMSLAGVSKSNHDLSISVGFDGEATYAQGPQTFTAGSAVTSVGPLEECKVSIGTRRWCQAIRFKIQDATPTNPGTYPVGTGQGATFDTLGLEIGIERGLRRLPATKRG